MKGRHDTVRWIITFLVVLLISCVDATGLCGCTPPPPGATVEGTVRDAAGAAVSNTAVYIMVRGVNGEFESTPSLRPSFPTTRADGSFATQVFGESGTRDARAAVYAGDSPIVVDIGKLTLTNVGERPNPKIDIRLP